MAYFNVDIYSELAFRTSRSGGAGGQHVNKTETKVEALYNIQQSVLIDEDTRQKLLYKLEGKLTGGVLAVYSQDSRSQQKNKEEAVKKLYAILDKALTPVKKRKKTRPSKSAVQKRLDQKEKRSEVKTTRKKFRL